MLTDKWAYCSATQHRLTKSDKTFIIFSLHLAKEHILKTIVISSPFILSVVPPFLRDDKRLVPAMNVMHEQSKSIGYIHTFLAYYLIGINTTL